MFRFTKKQRDKLSNFWLGKPKPWLRGKPLSLAHRKKIGESIRKKIKTPTINGKRERREYYREYHNKHKLKRISYYRTLRDLIVKHYGSKCVCCGENKKIQAHHLNGWNWCEVGRFDVNNGVTLCKGKLSGCHYLFHKQYGHGNNTKEQFEEFLLNTRHESLS